mgnify:CR=1 FL=1
MRHTWILASCAALTAALPASAMADSPGYPKDPTVVLYDVDPTWPQRPDTVAKFGWVSGMALDDQEQIWLFNKGEDPVQVYQTDGTFVKTWGKGMFQDPHQLRIDHDGNIWVADFGQHIVQKFTPDGDLLMTLGVRGEKGDDETHFFRPTDMAIAANGDVFVTDGYGNRRIVHLDSEGNYIKSWGEYGSEPGQFVLPHAIVINNEGTLFVADRNSGRIQLFNTDGEVLDVWSNQIMPWGLDLNTDGSLWVCGSSPHWWYRNGEYLEFKDQILMRFNPDGRVVQNYGLPFAEEGSSIPGETRGAHCMVQDSQGNVYIGDIYTERAQKFVRVTSAE